MIKNPTPQDILQLRYINGLHYKQIEKSLRTATQGPPQSLNYLDSNEDLRITMAIQSEFITLLSLTHVQIFQTLLEIYKSSATSSNLTVMIGQTPLSVEFKNTPYLGAKSPFGDTISFVYDLTLTHKASGITLNIPTFLPAFIERYGFYGTSNPASSSAYHSLPELPYILGLVPNSLENLKSTYESVKTNYAKIVQNENESRRQIVAGSIILKAFEKSGLSYPPFRTLTEWYAAIEDHIMLYAGKMDYQREYSAFRSAHEELDNLSSQGIDFADSYTLYCTELFHRLPGE